MAVVKVVTEFIDDTPLEFNHKRVLVLSGVALVSGLIVLALKRSAKSHPAHEFRVDDN
jgi:hypothetical protein